MGKDSLQIEWSLLEDEHICSTIEPAPETDKPAQPEPFLAGFALDELKTAEARSSSADRSELRLAALVVILPLLLAGTWAHYRQARQATTIRELQVTIAQEVGTPPVGGVLTDQSNTEQPPAAGQAAPTILHLRSSILAINSGDQPNVQIDELHRIGNTVRAHVTASYLMPQGMEQPYRETHFYWHPVEGWRRIGPGEEPLGPWQTLETKHFTIRYQLVDAQAMTEAAPRLDQLAELCCWLIEPDASNSIYPEVESVGGVVAMETLIEYVVATYGRESLPRLIAALGDHPSWNSLIPAVYDISADEFEAAWQSHLAHRYDTSPPWVGKKGPDEP